MMVGNSLEVLSFSYNKYYPSRIEPLNYSSIEGEVKDLMSYEKSFSVSSKEGRISLNLIFDNIPSISSIVKVSFSYQILSYSIINMTIKINLLDNEGKILKIYENKEKAFNSSYFKELSFLFNSSNYNFSQKIIKLNLEIISEKNIFFQINLKNFYLKSIDDNLHLLILYAFNKADKVITVSHIILFNSTDVEIIKINIRINPQEVSMIKIESKLVNPAAKLLTDHSIYLAELTV